MFQQRFFSLREGSLPTRTTTRARMFTAGTCTPAGGTGGCVPSRNDKQLARARHDAPLGLALVLGTALFMRLPFVHVDFGKTADMTLFRQWIRAVQAHGLAEAYHSDPTIGYPPGILYVFAVGGWIDVHLPHAWRETLGDALLNVLIKVPATLGDVLATSAVWYAAVWAHRRARSAGHASPATSPTLAALAYSLNPAVWYMSAYWGQVDGIYAAFAAWALVLLQIHRFTVANMALALSAIVKPQALVFAPVAALVTSRPQGALRRERGVCRRIDWSRDGTLVARRSSHRSTALAVGSIVAHRRERL